MHPEEIKAALRMRGITPAALADALGVAKATMSQVISGRTVSARIQAEIAARLGRPVTSIWPAKKESALRRASAPTAKKKASTVARSMA